MTVYMVGLRLDGESGDEITDRIAAWDLAEDEGVVSISAQPEQVEVPDELRAAPAAPVNPPLAPLVPTPPEVPLPTNGGDASS